MNFKLAHWLCLCVQFHLEFRICGNFSTAPASMSTSQQQQQQQTRTTAALASVDIRNAGAANSVFGSDTSLMVARPGKCGCFWFTIPEGACAAGPCEHARRPRRSTQPATLLAPLSRQAFTPWSPVMAHRRTLSTARATPRRCGRAGCTSGPRGCGCRTWSRSRPFYSTLRFGAAKRR